MQGHNWMNHVKLLDPTVTIVMAKVETDGWQNPAPLWRCTETLKNYKAQKLCFGAPLVVQGFCPPTVLICVYLYTVYIYMYLYVCAKKHIIIYIYTYEYIHYQFISYMISFWYTNHFSQHGWYRPESPPGDSQLLEELLESSNCLPVLCQCVPGSVATDKMNIEIRYDVKWESFKLPNDRASSNLIDASKIKKGKVH